MFLYFKHNTGTFFTSPALAWPLFWDISSLDECAMRVRMELRSKTSHLHLGTLSLGMCYGAGGWETGVA